MFNLKNSLRAIDLKIFNKLFISSGRPHERNICTLPTNSHCFMIVTTENDG